MIKIKVYRHGAFIGRYDTITAAAADLGISKVDISRALRNTVPVAKGYKFEKIRNYGHKKIKR